MMHDKTVEVPISLSRERYADAIERSLLFALGLFVFATPFAKVIASVAHSLSILLFLAYLGVKRGHVWVDGAKTYYRILVAYSFVFVVGTVYSPDPANGLYEAWRQVTRLMTPIMLIEVVSRESLVRRYQAAFVAGGVVLGLIGIYEATIMHAYRPPTMWHPVHGANILLLSFIASFAFATTGRAGRPYSISASFVILLAIYFTGTRGVWIAVLAVLLFLPFVLPGYTVRRKVAIAAAILLVMAMVAQTPIFRQRVESALTDIRIYQQEGKSNPNIGVAERLDMWKASYYMFRERPLTGVGTGAWRNGLEEIVRSGRVPDTLLAYGSPHNMFIEALTTRGVIGLVALCFLLGYPVVLAARARRTPGKERYYLLMLTATIAFVVGGLTDTLVIIRGVFTSYLTLTGLSLAVLCRPDQRS